MMTAFEELGKDLTAKHDEYQPDPKNLTAYDVMRMDAKGLIDLDQRWTQLYDQIDALYAQREEINAEFLAQLATLREELLTAHQALQSAKEGPAKEEEIKNLQAQCDHLLASQAEARKNAGAVFKKLVELRNAKKVDANKAEAQRLIVSLLLVCGFSKEEAEAFDSRFPPASTIEFDTENPSPL